MNGNTSATFRTLHKALLAVITAALLTGCGSGTISGGYDSSGFNPTTGTGGTGGGSLDNSGGGIVEDTTGGSGGGTPVVTTQCSSTGLATMDLAGQCRTAPQATMGAMEASS